MTWTDTVTYCFKWNFRKNRAGELLTEEEARARDASGEEYTAVVPTQEGSPPTLVTIVWKNDFVEVDFLDDPGRKYMSYSFSKRDGARLFLSNVTVWTYPNDDPKLRLSDAVTHESMRYRDDGHVSRVIVDKVENVKETKQYSGVPVEKNWEQVPEFGRYRSVARVER
jgi:hypothetical protein